MSFVMNREQIRELIKEIGSYHPATQFVRSAGGVQLLVPGGVTSEQQTLLTMHREEIYWYLTTPPDVQGQCWRGHEIKWVCTSGGIWLCICYYWTPERVNFELMKNERLMQKRSLNLKYRDYWKDQSQSVSMLASGTTNDERIIP